MSDGLTGRILEVLTSERPWRGVRVCGCFELAGALPPDEPYELWTVVIGP